MKTIGINEGGRVYEFWTSRQRAGKTTAMRSRAVDLARHASVNSVFWLDRLREVDPAKLPLRSAVAFRSIDQWHDSEEIPRFVAWQLGEDPAAYQPILQLAISLGDCAVIIDEAYEFAPAGATWTGSNELRSIVLAGAHLIRERDRELRPCHLLIAAQYPKSVHHMVWAQAYTVMVGLSSGENTFSWLRANFSTPDYDAVEAVARLNVYQWENVRGERPRLPGYGRI